MMEIPKHAKIELWPLEKIVPYEKNAKKHSPEQVEQIKMWIARAGWTQPIVVQASSGSIIAGHGRRLAALSLGLKQVPVIALAVDDKTAREMRLADNRVVSTDYDIGMMQEEIFSLKQLGVDIADLGFNAKEMDFLNEQILDFNEDAFIEDIAAAVEEQKTVNTEKQARIDEEDAPLARAFGFKRLTIAQGRKVRSFMTFIESETNKGGALALIAYIDTLGIK